MKKLSLLLMFALVIAGFAFGQLQTSSVTYTDGDIETDKSFKYFSGTQSSICPGTMVVPIPVGAVILQTDVSYDMTSDDNSAVYRQRSQLRCVSPGGITEPALTNGPIIYVPGTASYSRTGLDIANGVVGGGDVMFELHAGASYYKQYCSTDSVKVDNNTWTVAVSFIPPGFPAQALNPDPVNEVLYVGVDDDLNWDFGADTETYDVYLDTENPPLTKRVDNLAAGATGSFDPGTLDESQTYYWQIVSRNANGYTAGPVWSFTTACGAYATPFTEDFEEVTAPELPYCWQSIVNTPSTSAKVETRTYGGHNAPNCVRLYNTDDIDATLIFITPMVDVGAGSLADKMVNFWAKGEGFPGLSVGTMSDPTDESTFTAYETFYAYNSYKEYDIYLNDYLGTDAYIAFKIVPNASYQVAYLDEITIKDMPTCLRPTDPSADNLTINSATLSWTDPNGATAWNIEYGIAGFTPTGTPSLSGVSNPYELTGLESATSYDFYVQADCGGGDLSEWSPVSTFLTPCDFFEVPFSENFNDWGWGEMPPCWSTILWCADGFQMNGNQGGFIQFQNGSDINSTLMLISPPVVDLAPNRLKFRAKSFNDGYSLIIGTMSNPGVPSTFEALTSVTVGTDYEEYDVWLNDYVGTNNYFVIKHSNDVMGLTFQIDDVALEALPTCLPPADLFISDITTTTAIFNWSESGTATDWEIEIGDLGFEPGTDTFLNAYSYNSTSTELSYELSGLTASSVYDVYVRTDCGDEDYSPWIGPASFITSFEPFTGIPVTEDFENGLGITGNNFANTVDWVINTELQKSGSNSVHNAYTENNDNVLFLLGTFDFTAKTDVMLSFWHIATTDSNNDHCYIEISEDGGLTFDQIPVSTYAGAGNYREEGLYNNPEGPCFDALSYPEWTGGAPDNSWWRKEYFDLSAYGTSDNVVLRFRLVSNNWNNGAGWFIDDIAVEALGAPVFFVDPLAIDAEVTAGVPVANADLSMGNTGDFPAGFTARVVYDEMELINENFNNGIPADWTVVSDGTMNDISWEDTASIYGRNIDGTPLVWCDGQQNYTTPVESTINDDLISPVVDASAFTNGTLQLEFDQIFDANYTPGDTARVYVFDGVDWMMIYEAWTDDGSLYSGGVHKIYDVSAYANENFQVKFKYIEGSLTARGKYFAIDNVNLRASMSALDWLTVDGMAATSGVSMPNDGVVVDVEMNGTGFEYGAYTADIEVVSGGSDKAVTVIPVSMTVAPVAPPTEFTAVADMENINLTYNLNDAGNDVIIVTNTSDMFDQPENGTTYPVGSVVGSNGTVIHQGSMNEFAHVDLLPNTTYYYQAWSVEGSSFYSEEAAMANASTGDYQLICLPAGWSGVSTYKVSEDPALENVLSGIINETVIMVSNAGIFWPDHNINSIGDWDTQQGYKIKMNEDACFTVVGDMVENKTITLNAGASYIPVLCDQPVAALDIFAQLGDDLVFAYDLYTQNLYWPEGGIYTLEVLEPGVGYFINMAQPGAVTFGCEAPKANHVKAQKQVFENAPWVYTETGNQHLISINKSAFADLEKGDFIGVFDNYGTCAGYTQYNGEAGNLLLVAYSDDLTTSEYDGLQEGETMNFRIFSQSQMTDTEVAVEFSTSMPHAGTFADMGRSMILKMGEGATTIQETSTSKISMYPNPANNVVNINLNGDYSDARVVVYNTEGRDVINQTFSGQLALNVSSLKTGVYIVKINTGTKYEIRKLVIK